MKVIKRGDIYWADLEPSFGHEIGKVRPVLVVSNNIQNQFSPIVIILPITSALDKIYSFEVPLELDKKKGKILTCQIQSIDKTRLGKKIGILRAEKWTEVDKALQTVLDWKN